jgi:predicted metal-dependent hydrolase
MRQKEFLLADGQAIAYTLKFSARRRTVSFMVDHRGLTVHAPRRVAQYEVESLLRAQSSWIVKKLAQWANRPAAIIWQDGARLRYLGQEIHLAVRQDVCSRAVEFDGLRLHVALPNPEDHAVVQRKVVQWYARQCRPDFTRRLEILAAKLGVPVPPLYLSGARTQWGSCNVRGEIRLSWRLIQAPPHIIHYVAAHELAHLKEMNHSPAFWEWVQKLCPDYKLAKRDLKAMSAELQLI